MVQRCPQACALSILVQFLWVNPLLASEECEEPQKVWNLDVPFATIRICWNARHIPNRKRLLQVFMEFVWSCLCFSVKVSKSQGASTKKASMLLVNHECPFLKDELQRHRYLDKLDMIYEVRKISPQSF